MRKPDCNKCEFFVWSEYYKRKVCESAFRPFHTSWYYCVDLARENHKARIGWQFKLPFTFD